MRDPSGMKVCVMGLGRFGGGLGVTRWLAARGARVLVTDRSSPAALHEPLAALEPEIRSGLVRVVHGGHDPELLDGIDTLVVNPAVAKPWAHPFVVAAHERGICVTSEIAWVWARLDPSRVIGVTGTSGKSTTCAMIHRALVHAGRDAMLGGNIGGSLLSDLDGRVDPPQAVVLELSSAMLHWLGQTGAIGRRGPSVACVTSLSPNHLDWHGDAAHYESSKRVLTDSVGPGAVVVLGAGLGRWPTPPGVRVVRLTHDDTLDGCAAPGLHNARNAAAALAAARAFLGEGADAGALERAIRGFPGLEHRLRRLGEIDGVVYYDDSKSTVPSATLLAVDAVAGSVERARQHVIVGGSDKGVDLGAIADLAPCVAGLYTIGATGDAIGALTGGAAIACGTLERAMAIIRGRARPGDAVVLSPGCASWDQFEDYRERGRAFAELARASGSGVA